MQSIIFLNITQKLRLQEANISISNLTVETLKKSLTEYEFTQIMEDTLYLRKSGNLLGRLGFEPEDCVTKAYSVQGMHNPIPEIGIAIHGVLNTETNSIVLWLEEAPTSSTYEVLKVSLLNLVRSFENVMTFEKLKRTVQFEKLFLQKIC